MNERLVIAGTQSGVGKTTLTAGIITALRRRGLTVQPFKVGPDYIDPTYHTLAAGRTCRNLDTWMVPPECVRSLFAAPPTLPTWRLSKGSWDYLTAPAMTTRPAAPPRWRSSWRRRWSWSWMRRRWRSAAAAALGYQRFDDGLTLGGFIVNRAAGAEHGRGVASAIAKATGLPVLGWLPRAAALHVPERHLGLVPTREPGRWLEFTQAAGDCVAQHLDIDGLLAIARRPDFQSSHALAGLEIRPTFPMTRAGPVIAVARDEAFHFTYEDNLDLLRAAGAEIAFFSPLRDAALPAGTACVILSGGFPEIYAERLAANHALHAALHMAHRQGMPIYAECGGLMYLTQAIIDGNRQRHTVVGLLPGQSVMTGRLTLGYRLAQAANSSWLCPAGGRLRGHEFHYSAWEDRPAEPPPAWLLLPRSGEGEPRPEGACVGSLWASYVHLHFGAEPMLAENFVRAASAYARGGC